MTRASWLEKTAHLVRKNKKWWSEICDNFCDRTFLKNLILCRVTFVNKSASIALIRIIKVFARNFSKISGMQLFLHLFWRVENLIYFIWFFLLENRWIVFIEMSSREIWFATSAVRKLSRSKFCVQLILAFYELILIKYFINAYFAIFSSKATGKFGLRDLSSRLFLKI